MKRKPNSLKTASEKLRQLRSQISDQLVEARSKLEQVDKRLAISEQAGEVAARVREQTAIIEADLQLTERLHETKERVDRVVQDAKESSVWIGSAEALEELTDALHEKVVKPTDELLKTSGAADAVNRAWEGVEAIYGELRHRIKPYYAPEAPEELLQQTRDELLYINSCLLQISVEESAQFSSAIGKAVASKVAGAASAGALLGIAGAFGTAGTGTAIATLSGAAYTNSTLAWVGSLFGGGMAAGAVATAGLSILVGAGVYKALSSKARNLKDLTDLETRIIESCAFLASAIDDTLKSDSLHLDLQTAESLYRETLLPIHAMLKENIEELCAPLDRRNRLALRQHALVDFERQIIDGFRHWIEHQHQRDKQRYPAYAIAGVIYALITESAVGEDFESQLALEALRRVKTDWREASEATMSVDIAAYTPEQLTGLANNAKGIYHEMLFVENYNQTHESTFARIHEATNHAGSDVQIVDKTNGEVVNEFQLKAGNSESIVREHFEKYPDISVVATHELAGLNEQFMSSGINNGEITEAMDELLRDMGDNTVMDRVVESGGLAGLAACGLEAIAHLKQDRPLSESAKNTLSAMGIAAGSTAVVGLIFS